MTNKITKTNSSLHFHTQPDNLNCAQAILKGFQQEFNIDEREIAEFRVWGGGRAEGGMCGALFAAEKLLQQAGKPGIQEEFAAIASDTRCLEIKKGKFPCLDCVRLADELVVKRLIQEF